MKGSSAVFSGARILALAWAECRQVTRSGGYRFLTLVLVIVALIAAYEMRQAVPVIMRMSTVFYEVGLSSVGILVPMAASLTATGAMMRDARSSAEELVLSKPPSSVVLAWVRFGGVTVALMIQLGIAVGAMAVSAWLMYRHDISWIAVERVWLRAALVTIYFTGLSCALGLWTRWAIVAGLVLVYAIGVLMPLDGLMPVMRPFLVTYGPAYALLGIGLFGLAAGAWNRRRDPHRATFTTWGTTGAFLIAAFAVGAPTAYRWNGTSFLPGPAYEALETAPHPVYPFVMARKHPVPTLSFPTADGGSVRINDGSGRPALLLFWAASSDAPNRAAVFERAWEHVGRDRIRMIHVCVTDDAAQASDLLKIKGLRQPVIVNPITGMPGEDSAGLLHYVNARYSPDFAVGGILWPDGTMLGPADVSTAPMMPRRQPPSMDLESRLQDRAETALRQFLVKAPRHA